MNRRVRLELARCPSFPEGSAEHGYELRVPLTRAGYIDREQWHKRRGDAVFRRFWGEEEEQGHLRHGHGGWTLSFAGSDDDEVIFKGDAHRFAEGEYVSIRERDGVTRTFRV